MRIVGGHGVTLAGFDLNGADEFGVSWKVHELEDWESPPGNTGEITQNQFADGGWLGQSFLEPKTVRLVGRLYAPDRPAARAAIDRFKARLPIKALSPLVVSEDGRVEHRWVKVEGVAKIPRPTDVYASFDVLLSAPDSRLLSGDGSTPYQFQGAAFLPSASGGLQLRGAEVLRTNLCTNPGAEVNTSGWVGQAASLITDTAWAASGSRSFKVTPTGSGSIDMRAGNASLLPFGLEAGKTYRISATMRLAAPQISATGDRMRRVVVGVSTDNSTFSFEYGSQGANVAGEFRTHVGFTLPANATGVVIMLSNASSNVADVVWWDNILIEEAPQLLPYFDGDTASTASRAYAWTGAAGASTSTETSAAGIQAPFQITASVVNGSVTIDTIGDAQPPVMVRINGPATRPVIRDQDGGQMPLDITLDAGQWLDVDLDARTIKLNSTVSRRNLLRGPWITPRSGMILSLDAAVYNPATSMTVFWTDASN